MATKKEVLEQAARGEGCLGRAADDEPVFVLRAQDMLSPEIIDEWAERAEQACCLAAKVAEARELANQMVHWPGRKLPD